MTRDLLIQEVKSVYARLAQRENSDHMTNQTYTSLSPDAYYEKALEKAIQDISAGNYDDCASGLEVVERIANHKTKAQRIQDTIESTLQNIETTEEMMATETSNKKIEELKAANERRCDAISQMIREMKQEQAQEDLNARNSNVIGGGGNG